MGTSPSRKPLVDDPAGPKPPVDDPAGPKPPVDDAAGQESPAGESAEESAAAGEENSSPDPTPAPSVFISEGVRQDLEFHGKATDPVTGAALELNRETGEVIVHGRLVEGGPVAP